MDKLDFQKIILERLPDSNCEVKIYNGSRLPCTIICKKCGQELSRTRADSFLARARDGFKNVCKYCEIDSEKNKLKQNIQQRVQELNPDITCLNLNFKNRIEIVEWYCHKCGVTFKKTPVQYIVTPKCPFCEQDRIYKLNIETIKQRVLKEWGQEYTILSEEYKGTKHGSNKILVKHNICGFCWSINVFNFLQKHKGCPRCAASKQEKKIRNWLETNNFNFEEQKQIQYMGHLFRFDFYIENKFFLEYHGDQHFIAVPAWGGEEGLAKRQHYDILKQEYCQQQKIPLIILSGNLSSILNEELAQRLHSRAT